MSCYRRRALGIAIVAFLLLLIGSASFAETLNNVLEARRVPPDPQTTGDANRLITSYAFHDDAQTFLIAYYWDDGSGIIQPPLQISKFDKGERGWNHLTLPAERLTAGDVSCLGSVTVIHPMANAFYLDIHLTPSAGCILVLSKGLEVRAALSGWFLAEFADGTVVYHNSQIHFAPTHPAEVSIYRPDRDSSFRVYPMQPYQPVRTAHIEKVRAAYGDGNWCRERNHHCDPELFDNQLLGIVEINDQTRALAFVIGFDNAVEGLETERRSGSANAPESTEVVYIYRNVDDPERIEYKEMLFEEFQARFGDIPLSESLEPEILPRIFND